MYATILGVIREVDKILIVSGKEFYRYTITLLNGDRVIIEHEDSMEFSELDMLELTGRFVNDKRGNPYFEVHNFKIVGKQPPTQRRITDF